MTTAAPIRAQRWRSYSFCRETALVPESDPDETLPLTRRDVAALIGIVAAIEGKSLLGQLDAGFEDHITRRLVADGLLPASVASTAGMRVALANLTQRLHGANGVYPDGVPQEPWPE